MTERRHYMKKLRERNLLSDRRLMNFYGIESVNASNLSPFMMLLFMSQPKIRSTGV